MAWYRFSLVVVAVLLTQSAASQSDPAELGNWFNDPFFQVRDAFADCPTPVGPLTTHAQAIQQEHYRAERGTSCYLSGECKRSNAYSYDPDIGRTVQELFTDHSELGQRSSLWVTVSRRFVYLEGCSNEADDIAKFEGLIRSVSDVQTVLVNITTDPRSQVPYRVRKHEVP